MALIKEKSLYNTREVKKLDKTADKILALEPKIEKLSDEQLKAKTEEFKARLQKGETLDDILVEAYAVLREAAFRVLGKKHYKVQLIGGIVLHQGRIAEMKTGEGKTLVATLPAYLNALEGKGVHVITVNEYLVQRDRNEMNEIYEFLGLTSSVVIASMQPAEKKEAYQADITYGTNSEFGFDFLRDNMVTSLEEKVQRTLHYSVLDEVDSILIDEARTPLIIAGPSGEADELIKVADYFVKGLKHKLDYTIDKKAKMALLTDEGIEKAEKYFNVENFADIENFNIQHYVVQALKANYIMKNGVDYIIKEGKVHIVDQFTGRVMDGRRFSEGLHEAIEAKEEVKVQDKTKTMATITYQNFFKMYKKLSGMTGTAKTEEQEFREIYNLDVVVIPTNKPILRLDLQDIIYKTEYEKFKAVVKDIVETYKVKQPVLVGTVSIEKSELLSFMLKKAGVPHQVLNAKQHSKEAEIVAKAGQMAAVTISTNMAGRGTDIILGDGVKELGGLKVIGTERHESRRIDNQLRGRSGRQGDVGISRFYVSFEDDIIRNHTSTRFKNTVEKFDLEEDEAVEEPLAVKAVENAQKNVEAENFEVRKKLIQYDEVVNVQREIIYNQRDTVLTSDDLSIQLQHMLKDIIEDAVENQLLKFKKDDKKENKDEALSNFKTYIRELINMPDFLQDDAIDSIIDDRKALKEMLSSLLLKAYENKQEQLKGIENIEKSIILRVVDTKWVDHLEKMDHLKQYIGLQAYKQQDPVVLFQLEGSTIFNDMILEIKKEVIKYFFSIRLQE
jgi:preprotein translocase subunit SecA